MRPRRTWPVLGVCSVSYLGKLPNTFSPNTTKHNSSGRTRDAAADCYQKAANLFKMEKLWLKAGQAFCDAAKLQTEKHEAAAGYTDAANCYKKCDTNEAINCLLKAIEIYTDLGRFVLAAKLHQNIAEMLEGATDIDMALQHFEQAAEYFSGEENNSAAVRCLLKVAHLSAMLEKYEKAISAYQDAIRLACESTLLKYSVKEYILREVLCQMCVDVTEAEKTLVRYERTCPIFQDCREDKLMRRLMECVDEGDEVGFTEAVADYDQVSRFDQWFTTMLLRVKRDIGNKCSLR